MSAVAPADNDADTGSLTHEAAEEPFNIEHDAAKASSENVTAPSGRSVTRKDALLPGSTSKSR
jgi:hypothetical protein